MYYILFLLTIIQIKVRKEYRIKIMKKLCKMAKTLLFGIMFIIFRNIQPEKVLTATTKLSQDIYLNIVYHY